MSPSPHWTNQRAIAWTEQELLHALQSNIQGAVAIASTVRAARALRQQYNDWQRGGGNAAWMTPQIVAWEPWVQALWDGAILSGRETRMLLTDVQEAELWREVLAQDDAALHTLSSDALATQAQRAWRQMHQYGIPSSRLRGDNSVDAKSFSSWVTAFEKLCQRSSFLSSALMETAIARWIPSSEIQLPDEIYLLGFDRITPAQVSLINVFAARGASANFVELQPTGGAQRGHTLVCAATFEQEIASAALWVRQSLLKNPSQRIGVVVPSLEGMRSVIDRTFRRVLAPSSMDIRTEDTPLPYEFSLGTAMVGLQPIRTALLLLQWLRRPLLQEEVSWLLVHGAFSSKATSSDARARIDRSFRDRECQLGGAVSLSSFWQWLSQFKKREESAALCRTIEHFFIAAQRHGMGKSRSFADWSEILDDLLAAAEWHLPAAADSANYQLLQKWNTLLSEVSSLNCVTGPVPFPAVVGKIQNLAAHTLFTLETHDAPVQILGISESAGLVFDAVWWMNVQTGVWPSRGKAQPFLPWNIQREAHMPYADPAEDHAFTLKTTRRIFNSGKTVIASFALQQNDPANATTHIPEREILLSPLVREILPDNPIISAEDFLPIELRPRDERGRTTATALEPVLEEPAVPFQAKRVRGGVRFLELHAACPFRAFAELRLWSPPLLESEMGLSPGSRGTILHRVLERFWNEWKSQKNLLKSTAAQHVESLRRHIQETLVDFSQYVDEPWQQTLLQIEAERLEQRLLEWLEQEKLRPDFTVMKTEEQLSQPLLGEIEFRCRVDRIDRVTAGIVLLDYKTGGVDRGACEGDRPDQPQLLAYAALRSQTQVAEDALAGVAFAGLHPRKVEYTVIGSRPGVFSAPAEKPGGISSATRLKSKQNPAALSEEEMQSKQEAWSATVTRLAEAFRAGVVIVDPKKYSETCKHCAQSLLCRIGETAFAQEAPVAEVLDEEHSSLNS